MSKTIQRSRRLLLPVLIAMWCAQGASAEPLNLAQFPAGSAYRMPMPNVILSVDNSGSMDTKDGGSKDKTRMEWLKLGLQNTLINSTQYDNRFRLAWQSFTCNNIPSNQGDCKNRNTMGVFAEGHKNDFKTWVSALSANGWTPSHEMVWNAGRYLMSTGADSPWNKTPGTVDEKPLSCRKAYHVFLTDGGWNRYKEDIIPSFNAFDFQSKMVATSSDAIGDADQTAITFPDGVQYSTNDNQTQVFRGAGGANAIQTCLSKNWQGICTNSVNFTYPTLSDMAFYFWSHDLQPNTANQVVPSIKKSGDETFGNSSNGVTLSEYWNPKNNPATWQHLVHYTIGYGKTASTWTDSGKNPIMTNQEMYGSGFTDVVIGKKLWTDVTAASNDSGSNYDKYRPEDLWHMAINSRGKYFPVTGGDLTSIFDEIFGAIAADTTAPITGFTSSASSISRVGASSYQSRYVAAESDDLSFKNRWFGYLTSSTIPVAGSATPNADWGTTGSNPAKATSTADKLDALTDAQIKSRLIVSFNGDTGKGVPFTWGTTGNPTLSNVQKTLLNRGDVAKAFGSANGDNRGEDRLNFIRGDRSKENNPFRVRKSRQGDIVNSAIWYTGIPISSYALSGYQEFAKAQNKRTPILYVGGNDGMLHGFAAKDGTEKIAYVPQGLIKTLPFLADTNYDHRYYVDGSPFAGEVKTGGGSGASDWRTYLVGTLGAGGKGYFVLDITDPGNFTTSNAANLVVMDKTAAKEDLSWTNQWEDIGYIFGDPVVEEGNPQRALQITRTNDGRWAAILGNGYNSNNERPVLLIQYLDGAKELKTIVAVDSGDEAKSNGLSTPQLLDVNGDGIPDFVYAGDLRGNLWKFDISNQDPAHWGMAFSGSPLFTAKYKTASNATSRQPITTPPVLRTNRQVGGLMVAFGTGRNLTEGDRSDFTSVQSVYSVLDNSRYEVVAGRVKIKLSNPAPTTITSRDQLQSESIDDSSKRAGAGASAERTFWKLAAVPVNYTCPPSSTGCVVQKGWYMDLPESGERVLSPIDFYDGSAIMEIMSQVPASGDATADNEESCTPPPRISKNFRTLLNITSGMPATAALLNVSGTTTTVSYPSLLDPSKTVTATVGVYGANDAGYARMTAASKELRLSTRGEQQRIGSDGIQDNLSKLPELLIRPSWHQFE